MTAGAAAITATNPAPNIDAHRPVGVFISYASEDHDIAKAIFQSLQSLSGIIHNNLTIFFDTVSIHGGDEIRARIETGLKNSDFLLVLYTGQSKRSHGYTGVELGFFESLIKNEMETSGQTTRSIKYLCCGEPPSIGDGIKNISINIHGADLRGSRSDYVRQCKQKPEDSDLLASLFCDIANCAERRLPLELHQDTHELEKNVAEQIIPNLKGALFDIMSTRVARHSFEQKLLVFELPKSVSEQPISIPDETKLTPYSGAFEIFGIPSEDAMTWREFREEVKKSFAIEQAGAIEQAVISAVSPAIPLDNEQIIRVSNDRIFRVLVTRQKEYYNGQKVVDVCFIPKLQDNALVNNDTSTILGFINVAAKYRFIFVERDCSLSIESFMFEPDPAKIQKKVNQLQRELLLIEEESRSLKLDQVAAIFRYFGSDENHLKAAKLLQDKWYAARQKLIDSAKRIMGVPPVSDKFRAAKEKWLASLKSFRLTCDEINATWTIQALENLKKSFTMSRQPSRTCAKPTKLGSHVTRHPALTTKQPPGEFARGKGCRADRHGRLPSTAAQRI